MANSNTRFTKQPGRIVIFDLDIFNQNEIESFSSILKEYFEIVCSLLDVNQRIPYLMIVIVKSKKIDSLLFLDSVYGKKENIISFLNNFFVHSSFLKQTKANYALIIQETLKKLPKTLKSKSKAEIEFFSKNMHQFDTSKLNESEEKIKKIWIVNLYTDSKISEFDIDLMDIDEACILVEFLNLKNNKCNLTEHFKNWLNEVSEYEHIQLNFPSNTLVLKCDILERILDLDKVFDSAIVESIKFYNSSKSNIKKNNKSDEFLIYKLEISKLVSLNGICESIVYGENKGAICQMFQTNDKILKARYLLIPVTNKKSNVSVLLMKPIASNYVLLNSSIFTNCLEDWKAVPSQSEFNESDKKQFFEFNLKEIPYCEIYNPLEED